MRRVGLRLAAQLAAVVFFSCLVGCLCKLTIYSAEGQFGAYYEPYAVEYTDAEGVDVWSCSESPLIPSWRCPAWDGAHIRSRLNAGDWRPVPLGVAVALASVTGRDDWSGCEVNRRVVRCPDGFTTGY